MNRPNQTNEGPNAKVSAAPLAEDDVLYLGIDLGTNRSSVTPSNGIRATVATVVDYLRDEVSCKLLNREVIFGDEALAYRLTRPVTRSSSLASPSLWPYGLYKLNEALVVDIEAGTNDLCRMHGAVPSNEDQVSLLDAGDHMGEKPIYAGANGALKLAYDMPARDWKILTDRRNRLNAYLTRTGRCPMSERRWGDDYQKFAKASVREGHLLVSFENGDDRRVRLGQLLPLGTTTEHFDWSSIAITDDGLTLFVPGDPHPLEISWEHVRQRTDLEFQNHIARLAEEQALLIGRRLKNIREQKGLTQREVARAAGMEPSNLSRIESGRVFLATSTLWKVLAAMGCSIFDLASIGSQAVPKLPTSDRA